MWERKRGRKRKRFIFSDLCHNTFLGLSNTSSLEPNTHTHSCRHKQTDTHSHKHTYTQHRPLDIMCWYPGDKMCSGTDVSWFLCWGNSFNSFFRGQQDGCNKYQSKNCHPYIKIHFATLKFINLLLQQRLVAWKSDHPSASPWWWSNQQLIRDKNRQQGGICFPIIRVYLTIRKLSANLEDWGRGVR